MIVTAAPKSPVTWVLKLEMSEAEVEAWKAFAYRLKDGIVTTGIVGEQGSVLNNTFSPLYEGLVEVSSYNTSG